MTQDLEPIAPQKAVDLYLAQREDDASERTVQAHRYRLKHFVRWCGQEDLTNLNDLTSRRLYEYRLWRKDDGDLNPVSLRTQLSTLRAFVRFFNGGTRGISHIRHISFNHPILYYDDRVTRECE